MIMLGAWLAGNNTQSVKALRALRALRPLRTITRFDSLRAIVVCFLEVCIPYPAILCS